MTFLAAAGAGGSSRGRRRTQRDRRRPAELSKAAIPTARAANRGSSSFTHACLSVVFLMKVMVLFSWAWVTMGGSDWSSHQPQLCSPIRRFFVNLWFYCLSLLPCIPEIGELTMLRAKTGHPLSALTVQVRRKASVISSENLA